MTGSWTSSDRVDEHLGVGGGVVLEEAAGDFEAAAQRGGGEGGEHAGAELGHGAGGAGGVVEPPGALGLGLRGGGVAALVGALLGGVEGDDAGLVPGGVAGVEGGGVVEVARDAGAEVGVGVDEASGDVGVAAARAEEGVHRGVRGGAVGQRGEGLWQPVTPEGGDGRRGGFAGHTGGRVPEAGRAVWWGSGMEAAAGEGCVYWRGRA